MAESISLSLFQQRERKVVLHGGGIYARSENRCQQPNFGKDRCNPEGNGRFSYRADLAVDQIWDGASEVGAEFADRLVVISAKDGGHDPIGEGGARERI